MNYCSPDECGKTCYACCGDYHSRSDDIKWAEKLIREKCLHMLIDGRWRIGWRDTLGMMALARKYTCEEFGLPAVKHVPPMPKTKPLQIDSDAKSVLDKLIDEIDALKPDQTETRMWCSGYDEGVRCALAAVMTARENLRDTAKLERKDDETT